MKRIIFTLTLILTLLLTSCAGASDGDESGSAVLNSTSTNATEESKTEPTETGNPDEKKPAETNGIGGGEACEIHEQFYHMIPLSLMEYVGMEEFEAWVNSDGDYTPLNGCSGNHTLYDFIVKFNVPKEVLEEQYLTSMYYNFVLDLDVIYSGSREKVDDFFLNVDRLGEARTKRSAIYEIKNKLAWENIEEWNAEHGDKMVLSEVSVAEMVNKYSVTRETLEALIKEKQEKYGVSYDYDLSVIYNEDGTVIPYDTEKKPLELDAEFCRINDYYTD